MLLIFPPLAKPCEPPAGIARLAGAVQAAGRRCTIVDANIEGISFLLQNRQTPEDTWSKRAVWNKTLRKKGTPISNLP